MHKSNELFWKYCSDKYNEYFHSAENNIVEFGSLYVNGSIRKYFSKHNKYIGVDWLIGRNVDVVTLAHKFKPDIKFNTIVSASMLEHDPFWALSIQNMISLLHNNGIMILTWGAAYNRFHDCELGPDNCFHKLPAEYVIDLLQDNNVFVQEFRYEKLMFHHDAMSMGEVGLVAFKDKTIAEQYGKPIIDCLLINDKMPIHVEYKQRTSGITKNKRRVKQRAIPPKISKTKHNLTPLQRKRLAANES